MSDRCRLKIYGERNTGTNYLEDLARMNLETTIISGRAPDRHIQIYISRLIKLVSQQRGMAYRRAWRDKYLSEAFDRHLGWKHMNPSVERLGPERLASVRFLIVVKNPYAWLLSLFRRPYNIGGKDDTLEAFLDRKMPIMPAMENIGTDQVGPVEVWNRKMAGYFTLMDAATRAKIVKYEDFLQDEEGMLRSIATDLEIGQRPDFVSIERGAKGDADVSRQYYIDYYMQQKWREKLNPTLVQTINAQLDHDLVTRLGYEVISPDEF